MGATWLQRAVQAMRKVVHPLSYAIHCVAAVILTAMMLLVASAVTGRYVFNAPILGDLELITLMMAGLISFSLAYCAVMKGHVSVTFLVTRLPYRAQAIINVLMNIATLVFLIMIAWYSVHQAIILWNRGTATIIFKVPLFPFALVLAFGSAVFALVTVIQVLESLSKGMNQ